MLGEEGLGVIARMNQKWPRTRSAHDRKRNLNWGSMRWRGRGFSKSREMELKDNVNA